MDKEQIRKELGAAGLLLEEGSIFSPLKVRGTLMLADDWSRWQFERIDESSWVAYSEDHSIPKAAAEELTKLWPGIRCNEYESAWCHFRLPFIVDSAHPDSLAALVKVLKLLWIIQYGDRST